MAGEPVTSGMESLGTPILVAGSEGTDLNTWVCGSHESGTSALVGMTAGGGKVNVSRTRRTEPCCTGSGNGTVTSLSVTDTVTVTVTFS